MMKLAATILKPRGNHSGKLSIQSNYAQDVFIGRSSYSTIGKTTSSGDRIFAAYYLYKGKAALAAEPYAPTFGRTESGDLFVKRPGSIMLSFSPAKGERKYDWDRKQRFALSATEVGTLISLGPSGSCDFFHDPGMQKGTAGQVRKGLKVQASPDGTFYFFTLSVTDTPKKINDRFTVQVTPGEFSVMRTSFSFALPHIMGWDQYSNQQPKFHEYSNQQPKFHQYSNEQPTLRKESYGKVVREETDSEWDR